MPKRGIRGMFVRTKTVKTDKKEYNYYQLVESVYKKGRRRQKVVMTLGRVEDFDRSRVDKIVSALQGYTDRIEVLESMEDCHHLWSKDYGNVFVLERLWKDLGLDWIFRDLLRSHNYQFDVESAIKGMVFGRAIDARSKRSTYEWLERQVYRPDAEQVDLHHLYRALDFLVSHKTAVESWLYGKLRNLFAMDVSVIFYDCSLVDTYGEEAEVVRRSRNHKNQFLISLVLSKDGLPIGHEVLPGNTPDIKTVKDAMQNLKDRYSIGRCIFVGDRGMVSQKKLDELEGLGYEYIVGVKLNQWKEVKDEVLTRAGRYSEIKDNLHVKEISVNGKRYLICYNPFEAERDKRTREELISYLEDEIDGLDPATKKAAELYGDQYKGRFLRRLKDGTLRVDRSKVRDDEKYDGKYILLTSEKELSAEEIATTYKQLWRIERSFRSLKSIHDLEPVFHSTDERIRAHACLCVLSHLLERLLERKLEAEGLEMTASRALKTLGEMRVTKVQLKKKEYLIRTDTTPEMNEIFQALHYRPPTRIEALVE